MIIRKFKDEDAVDASKMIEKCFLTLNLGNYSKGAIENQIEENSPDRLKENSKLVKYYVAVIDDNIEGIGGFDTSKIRTFFVNPELQKKGIGKQLMLKVLSEAKKDGLKQLYCWSTLYAEGFYEKYGFKRMKEITLTSHNKSKITFLEMNKLL